MIFEAHAFNRKQEIALVFCSLLVSTGILYDQLHAPWRYNELTIGCSWHLQAYDFYKYGISNKLSNDKVRVKNFVAYTLDNDNLLFKKPSIYDPVVFSAFCALIWQLTGSPSLISLMILNIILFSLLIVLLYRVFVFLLKDSSKAFMSTLGAIAFFPLSYHNISNIRDIYHFYAFVLFLYFTLTFIYRNKKVGFLIFGAVAFVVCQWARPVLLSSFVMLSLLFLLWGCFEPLHKDKIFKSLSVFWLISILLFWIPFCTFNKVTYDKYFFSALGENLLSSLYGTPFPNGDAIEHTTGKFVERKTGKPMKCGTFEGDDACMKLYKKYVTKFPLHALKCMVIRLQKMLWSDIVWRNYYFFEIKQGASKFTKLKILLVNWNMLLESLSRIYVRLLIVLGYVGMIFAYRRKKYLFLSVILFGVLFSSGYLWFFHIEQRVLAVHQWAFGVFALYGLACAYELLMIMLNKKIIGKWFSKKKVQKIRIGS